MDVKAFKESIADSAPPAGFGPALQALWWDAKGEWNKAHDLAQEKDDRQGMLVHAYLHRKEGDAPNAAYWYRRAGATPSTVGLDEEWIAIVEEFLARG